MRVRVFAIYDSVAQLHMSPVTFHHDAQAVRAFGELLRDESSQVGKNPDDYALFHIGYFDDNSGELEHCMPRLLIRAAALLEAMEDPSPQPLNLVGGPD